MPSVTVGLEKASYDIEIEHGSLDKAGERLAGYARNGRLVIVTDSHVADTVLPRLTSALASSGLTADPIVLPVGEATKSWMHLAELCDALLSRGIDRSDHIVALGGGMIGDLTGFAAAILKRGCKFIQIPTTLLAQVDSSVGGKTAINTAAGKNLVGAFHQPSLVLIDPSVLDTLPMRERRAGYAEVIKYGLIGDAAFFDWCVVNGQRVLDGDADALTHAIMVSVSAKAAIVAADERETRDVRALLNLGHTFGHALEAETGFSDQLLHGEAVAAGMALAFAFSARNGICPQDDGLRVADHLRAMGLPGSLAETHVRASGATLVDHMRHDKKKTGNTLPFILARGIGEAYVDKSVSLDDVARFLDETR
jgi:3-dehydroquinate synthase